MRLRRALFQVHLWTALMLGAYIVVISVSGSEDGLSTPEKIADARHLLPGDAEMHEIEGANHASFGDYGPQPGDGTATISDDDMREQLTELVGPFALAQG